MRLDLYRRPETGGKFSYLAVLEGKPIPEEANNTDWQLLAQSIDISDDEEAMPDYAIEHPFQQIDSKGYAITSVTRL